MDRKAQRARLFLMAFDGALALLLLFAFGLLAARNPIYYIGRHPEMLLLPVFFVLFLHLGGLYDIRRRWEWSGVLPRAAAMTFLAVLFFHLLHAVTSTNVGVETVSASLCFSVALGVTVVRGAFLPLLRKKLPVEKAIVFGGGWGGREALTCLKRKPWGGIRAVGIIDDSPAKKNFVYRDIPVLGTRDALRDVVKRHGVGLVINAAPQVGNDEIRKALANGTVPKVRIVGLETFYEETTGRLMLQKTGKGWVVRERRGAEYSGRPPGGMKRLRDVLYALVTLGFASPLWAVTATLLKALSGQTVLVQEEMSGVGGQPFHRLSFRTGGRPRRPWTARPLAALQRALHLTGLKELPAVVNVLKGEMSFFGPVSETPEFAAKARGQNPLYDLRLQVRPGLFGWAEVNLPGSACPADHQERLGYDLYYVKNVSSRLDRKILAGLFKTVLLSPERF